MRYTTISLLIALLNFSLLFGQETPPIDWSNHVYDYGLVKKGIPYTQEFKFTNTGSEAIIIDNVRTNCKCIIPYWKDVFIEPNEKGSIFIVFMTNKSGIFNKGILINVRDFPKASLLEVKAYTDDIPNDLLVQKSSEIIKDIPSGDYGASASNTQKKKEKPSGNVPGDPFRKKKKNQPPTQPVNKKLPNVLNNTDDKPSEEFKYMTKREKAMIDEINLVRSNPNDYIPFVEDYINNLQKEIDEGATDANYYKEEIKAANELIRELSNIKRPLSTLQPHEGVYEAARKHGLDMIANNSFSHIGSDNSYPWDRITKNATDLSDGNENLVGGPYEVRQAVIILLADSGIEDRGHRKTMLNPFWNFVDCYEVGLINKIPNCWVQNFGRK